MFGVCCVTGRVCLVSTCSNRSLDDANRPDRRAVLDRERARSVAEKQAQALEDARAAAERKTQQKMQVCEYEGRTQLLYGVILLVGANLIIRRKCNVFRLNDCTCVGCALVSAAPDAVVADA